MNEEKIVVTTESGKQLEVVVAGKNVDAIWIVLGAGVDSVKCKLVPTNNGLAYAGSIMGREIVYARSVREVRDDIARQEQALPSFRRGFSGRRPR